MEDKRERRGMERSEKRDEIIKKFEESKVKSRLKKKKR